MRAIVPFPLLEVRFVKLHERILTTVDPNAPLFEYKNTPSLPKDTLVTLIYNSKHPIINKLIIIINLIQQN
jgi:hypothetical protein